MYDFVLFENFNQAINHYKDLCIIAKLLRSSGYSVAIADVFAEAKYCHVEGIPHIPVGSKIISRFDVTSCKIRYLRGGANIFYSKIVIPIYLRIVIHKLKGVYHNLYAGSYHTDMSIGWLKKVPLTASVFFWGLRSSRLVEHLLHPQGKTAKSSKRIRKYFDCHPNLKFFVSNELIKQEFLEIGISENRIVIRPERIIEKIDTKDATTTIKNKKGISLLSIGSLRESKRIEIVLDALLEINDNNIQYVIAGKASDVYEKVIEAHLKGFCGVKRLNYRIPEQEYYSLIEQCDFLVLCDEKQDSSVTNGTMNEALLLGKPIIAPNYNPYKYYIEKYNIGILFDPSKSSSIIDAIKLAQKCGSAFYFENIKKYQSTLLYNKVVESFSIEMKRILCD